MLQEPVPDIDKMTPRECHTQFRISEAPTQDGADHPVTILHLKTILKCTFVGESIAKNRSDRVLHAVSMRSRFQNFR